MTNRSSTESLESLHSARKKMLIEVPLRLSKKSAAEQLPGALNISYNERDGELPNRVAPHTLLIIQVRSLLIELVIQLICDVTGDKSFLKAKIHLSIHRRKWVPSYSCTN